MSDAVPMVARCGLLQGGAGEIPADPVLLTEIVRLIRLEGHLEKESYQGPNLILESAPLGSEDRGVSIALCLKPA